MQVSQLVMLTPVIPARVTMRGILRSCDWLREGTAIVLGGGQE